MHTITRTSPPTHLHSHKSTMAAGRCPKWSTSLKEDFRRHIEAKRINPKRTDKEYILQIRDRYYPGRPDDTFLKNYNASVSEWRIGHYVNAYNNRHKDREFCFFVACLFQHLLTRLFSQIRRRTTKTTRVSTETSPAKKESPLVLLTQTSRKTRWKTYKPTPKNSKTCLPLARARPPRRPLRRPLQRRPLPPSTISPPRCRR